MISSEDPTGPEAQAAREECLRRVESCLYGSLAAMVSLDGHLGIILAPN
jgi:hypothetical protein